MAAAAPFLLAGGTAISVLGALNKGSSDSQAAAYNAQLAEQNAELSQVQADEQLRRQQIEGKKSLGGISAGAGVSGVSLEGTPMEIYQESAKNIALDALQIKYNAQVRRQNYRDEARLQRMTGQNAIKQSYYGAASALLSGGAGLAGAGYLGGNSGGGNYTGYGSNIA